MSAEDDLSFLSDDLKKSCHFLVGIDEVGRGPLAGPVVAASACFCAQNKTEFFECWPELKMRLQSLGVCDSKKLTHSKRVKIIQNIGIDPSSLKSFQVIELEKNLSVCLYEVDAQTIDRINILQSSLLAMAKSFEILKDHFIKEKTNNSGLILVDGNKRPPIEEEHVMTVIKGDQRSLMIGLSSIFAKVYRDQLMVKLDKQYPGYGWAKNAGYPSVAHKEAIKVLGMTPFHRQSFKGVKEHVTNL